MKYLIQSLIFLSFMFILICSLEKDINTRHKKMGGYNKERTIPNNQQFSLIDQKARQYSPTLLQDAEIVSVSTQVVSGTNYKIHYKTKNNLDYQVIIYHQPWTETINLLSMQKIIVEEDIL